MQLGPFSTETPVFMAPMAGVTDLPMRQLAVKHGADLAVGEMIASDLSLRESRKSKLRTRHSAEAGLRTIQLVGNDPSALAAAARYNVEHGAEVIDINMGCPAKKVCKKAAGSALLADPQLVETLLTAVTQAISVPVTLKIRTGVAPDQRNGVEIARIAEACGITMLTVHGRTREDKFNGSAEYDTLRQIVSAVTIPVIANGDITSTDKAKRVLSYTGAEGIMIGRAAQGRLWLPGAIARALRHGDERVPSRDERFAIMREHVQQVQLFHGPVMGYKIARKHAGWFFEAELGEAYLPIKRAFNVLENADAQENFLNAQQGTIISSMSRFHETSMGRLAT
jgi:tRNA-dihydrouridine synthase B